MSQVPQEVETYLIHKNYFIKYLFLQFQERNITLPYLVINISKDDAACMQRIQSHSEIFKRKADSWRFIASHHQ